MRPRSAAMMVAEHLFRVCREMDEQALGNHEITQREIAVLEAVVAGTSAVPGVGAKLGISSSSATQIVERLEHREFIVRTKTRGRRVFTIELTREGRLMLEKHRAFNVAVEAMVRSRYGDVRGGRIVEILHEMGSILSAVPISEAPLNVEVEVVTSPSNGKKNGHSTGPAPTVPTLE